MRRAWPAVLAVCAVAAAGCGSGPAPSPAAAGRTSAAATGLAVPSTAAPTAAPTPRHHPRRHASPSPSPRPRLVARVRPVTAADLGASWHRGCPVAPAGLRAVTLTYWGFDGRPHEGTLVANAAAVSTYRSVFRTLFAHRFPIRRMVPVAAYGGSDDRSMAHDNTSSFNCRAAVSDGPTSWSMHAYGLAVDIDPVENPYSLDGKVLPPQGRPYMDRSDVRPGMVVAGSLPVRAFAAAGWGWGGAWSGSPDYQHFSSNGR